MALKDFLSQEDIEKYKRLTSSKRKDLMALIGTYFKETNEKLFQKQIEDRCYRLGKHHIKFLQGSIRGGQYEFSECNLI